MKTLTLHPNLTARFMCLHITILVNISYFGQWANSVHVKEVHFAMDFGNVWSPNARVNELISTSAISILLAC